MENVPTCYNTPATVHYNCKIKSVASVTKDVKMVISNNLYTKAFLKYFQDILVLNTEYMLRVIFSNIIRISFS